MAENEEYQQISRPDGKPVESRRRGSRDIHIEEYRLVPVEEAEFHDNDEKVVDFVGLARDLWDHRRLMAAVFAVFAFIGLLFWLFGERTWYSETSLMPETRSSSGVDRLLQQYQGILGVQLPGSQDRDELSVNLYPKIVESFPFQIELLQREVHFESLGRTMTLFEYFTDVRDPNFLQQAGNGLWSATMGLPRTVAGLFRGQDEPAGSPEIDFSQYSDLSTPWLLQPGIRQAAGDLERWISVRVEPQNEFIIIGASMPDARASAETVHVVKELLTRYVTEHRVIKATQDMEFIEGQYRQAKVRFEQAQDSLAVFRDRNIHLSTARSMVIEQRLQSEYNLTLDVYTSLATRLEEAKIKIQEDTPVFRIHEPIMIPSRPATPNLARITGGVLFFGFFVGVALIYIRRALLRFYTDFRNRS